MSTKTTTTIRERAQWHLNNFERGERESELPTDGKIWVIKDERPQATVDLVRTAHTDPGGDQMLPDDWRYEYIVDALYSLVEMDEDATEDDYIERSWEIEGEPYHSNLTAWAASHLYRPSYADEAIAEFGLEDSDTMNRLFQGNLYEQRFVFESVLMFIQNEIS